MKVFLVFIGLMLVNITFIAYQGDLHRYLRIQEFLKATAEECACGAAQYYDEEAYSRGLMEGQRRGSGSLCELYYIESFAGILTKEIGGSLLYQMEIIEGAGEPERLPRGGGETYVHRRRGPVPPAFPESGTGHPRRKIRTCMR